MEVTQKLLDAGEAFYGKALCDPNSRDGSNDPVHYLRRQIENVVFRLETHPTHEDVFDTLEAQTFETETLRGRRFCTIGLTTDVLDRAREG